MFDAEAPLDTPVTPQEPTFPKGPLLGLLRTRCGCQRMVDLQSPPPQTVTVELAPLVKDEKEPDIRMFYLMGMGTVKQNPGGKRQAALYQEGPAQEQSLIQVPGMPVPKRLR